MATLAHITFSGSMARPEVGRPRPRAHLWLKELFHPVLGAFKRISPKDPPLA